MQNNRNFQKLLQNQLYLIKKDGIRQKLLLHACCGPCFTVPYEILKDYFDITIMYNNSNIYPKEEHDRRLNELKKYLNDLHADIKVIEEPYGYKYAVENGFDYFGTVMTISRYKNAQDINKIGEELQQLYPTVKWLYADFKKNDGYEKSLIIIKEHEMYFQEYCGCKYSYEAYQKKYQ